MFEMTIEGAFVTPSGRVALTGIVNAGELRAGMPAFVHSPTRAFPVELLSLESYSSIHVAYAGDNVAVLVCGVTKDQVPSGSRLSHIG